MAESERPTLVVMPGSRTIGCPGCGAAIVCNPPPTAREETACPSCRCQFTVQVAGGSAGADQGNPDMTAADPIKRPPRDFIDAQIADMIRRRGYTLEKVAELRRKYEARRPDANTLEAALLPGSLDRAEYLLGGEVRTGRTAFDDLDDHFEIEEIDEDGRAAVHVRRR